MSTRLLGRPTGASPSVSAWHSSFPRAWSPNEARWEPPRGVIPELLLDRTALRGRQPLASEFDKTLIARGRGTPEEQCHRGRLEEVPYPRTIPGLGWTSVAGLLAHVGAITKYHHGRPLIKLAGTNPSRRDSGQTVGHGQRMSHRGQAPRSPLP